MCIAVWVWQAHPVYPLLLLLNRDELHSRPTKPLHWWGEGEQKVLGGRDVLAGGTWLGCTRDGKVALLTNVLEPIDPSPNAKSRGDLPLRFLQSKKTPMEFAKEIAEEGEDYSGFNLILADLCSKTMIYLSNRPKGEPISIQVVSPGIHVLSNAKLDTPWHKSLLLGKNFKELLSEHGEEEVSTQEMVEKLMKNTIKADRDKLPGTGCDPEWEYNLSSIFINTDSKQGRYGTRCTAALTFKPNGDASFYEKYLESGVWKDHTVEYHIKKMN